MPSPSKAQPNPTQAGRLAWLQARRDGIGGSDVGALICPDQAFGSPLSVYADKAGISPLDGGEPSTVMRIGSVTEAGNLALFAETTGARLWSREEILEAVDGWPCEVHFDDGDHLILRSTKHPELLATLDAVATLDGATVIVDAKYHSHDPTHRYESAPRGCPESYYLQVQTYLLVTGADLGMISAIGGREHVIVGFGHDAEAQAAIVAAAEDMVRRVAEVDPPEPVGSDADGPAIAAMADAGGPVEGVLALGSDVDDLDLEFIESKRVLDEAKARHKIASDAIKLALGSAEKAETPAGVKYSHKAQDRSPSLSLTPDQWSQLADAIDPTIIDPKLRGKVLGMRDKAPSSFRVLRRTAPKASKGAA